MNGFISNDILTLRALEPTDIDIIYKWENDSSAWFSSNTTAPYSRQLIWQYLKDYTGNIYETRELRLMMTLTGSGEPIGTIDFFNFSPTNNRAEVGLLIAEEYRHKGYSHQAVELIKNYAANYIGLRQLYATISVTNTECIELFTHCGFEKAGTLKSWIKQGRQYHDAVVLQCIF